MDPRITRLMKRQVGLATRAQLHMNEVSDDVIYGLIDNGTLETVQPGLFRVAGHPVTWDQRLTASLLVCGGGSAISFEAAAMYWKVDILRADKPHVTVVHAQKVRPGDFVVHRTRLFVPGDVVCRGPLRITSPLRTIIDLAGVLSVDVLEDALDDALRRRLVTVRQLRQRLEIRGGRGVPGVRNLRRLLDARDGQRPKASSLQNRFRRELERARLPMPIEEYPVSDSSGRFIARVDFAYPEKKVYIEVDGSHHETRKQKQADLAR